MTNFLLTILCLMVTNSASAEVDWTKPPPDQTQYQRYQLPISQQEVQKVRQALKSLNPGYKAESRDIILANRVRTGSGGGGAVACFQSESDAEQVIDRNTRRFIPGREYLIQKLFTYDAVVNNQLRKDLILAQTNESVRQYLHRVLTSQIGQSHPAFAQKLFAAINEVDSHKWLNRQGLEFLNDTGNSTTMISIKECAVAYYIQVVIRYSQSNHDQLPKTVLDADYALLARMHATNTKAQAILYEALLVLHEALYAMATEMGHWGSLQVRQLAGDLLSKNLDQKKLSENLHLMFMNLDRFMSIPPQQQGASQKLNNNSFTDKLRNADAELQNYLLWLVQQAPTLRQDEPMWDIKYHPNKMRQMEQKLMSSDPILSFLFQARYTSIRNRPYATPDVSEIYLKSNSRDIFEFYCQSIQKDGEPGVDMGALAKGLGMPAPTNTYDIKNIAQRAFLFCESNGVAKMVGPEAHRQFYEKYRNFGR